MHINTRFQDAEVREIEEAAKILTEKEGRPVTKSDVLRRQRKIGAAVMAVEIYPTNPDLYVTLLHSSATLTTAAAVKYFSENPQTSTAQ